MSDLGWSPGSLETFDVVTSAVTARGSGITMKQLSAAGALARELDKPEPDVERVEAFLGALDLTEDEVEELIPTGGET